MCGHYNMWFATIILTLALLQITPVIASNVTVSKNVSNNSTKSIHIAESFTDPDVLEFNHLRVSSRGIVYIGAVNRLYQLFPDLRVQYVVKTGPEMDSDECSVIGCGPNVNKKLTDNYNKVLILNPFNSQLVVCGSLFQGICTIYDPQNINKGGRVVREPVVANNATASTVAFIAHGPNSSVVMYVGATFTSGSIYRHEVPAVSSRSLEEDRMFSISRVAVTTGTRIFVDSMARERYPIKYVYGFDANGFSYFLTVQLHRIGGTQFISKLVRICQGDSEYYSYTEIPIVCISESANDGKGRNYNLVQAAYVGTVGGNLGNDLDITEKEKVLFAVFSEGDPIFTNKPTNNSALCIYSLASIELKFTQNIKDCFNGSVSRGLDFISPDQACVTTNLHKIDQDYCGLDVNSPFGGDKPVPAIAAYLSNKRLTAVSVTYSNKRTIAFLGTEEGHVIKTYVESGKSAVEYAEIVVKEGSPINPDMYFDPSNEHLYAMTKRSVYKIRVQACKIYKNCVDCLAAKDPFCGWCSLHNTCSAHMDCRDITIGTDHWIGYKKGRCTTISSVVPNQLQRTTARTLDLAIENLPNISGKLFCAFTVFGKTIITNATRKGSGVNCTTPRTDLLPPIQPGQHHFTAKLSVRMATGPDFVVTNFTFFDCNTFTSCTQCVSSPFPCDWCVDGHRCTHDTAENCRNDILVTGINRAGPSYRSGPAFCPILNATVDNSPEILIASGVKMAVKVKVHIIGQFIVQTRFVCQFNIEGRVTSVNAQLLGDTIYCDAMEFSYTSRAPNITATFAVIWGGSKPLDNPYNIHIVIYRCHDMADNCGMCLALPNKYDCGWCQSSDRCEVKDQCGRGSSVWLNRSQTCPNPEVLSFSPALGPWEGGTNISIEGINLGKTFEDIYRGVSIAGINCQPYPQLYVRTRRIVCKVDGPGTDEARHGPVVVRVGDYRGESRDHFNFVNPVITGISPRYGPKSGGTMLQITGKYMNAGSSILAFIGDSPCRILSTDESQALCITSASDKILAKKIHMQFDKGDRFYEREMFQYVDDPIIESTESGITSQIKVPKGIPAGGIKISVFGRNLAYIQKPQMYVYYEHKMFVSECAVISNTSMACSSPVIEVDESKLDAEDPLELEYGFRMDNVSGVQNLTRNHGFRPFQLFPNPTFLPFEKEVKHYKSEYLNINGLHINHACQESDVEVRIGNSFCNVTSLSRLQLTCRPPENQPFALDDENQPTNELLPKVTVIVGNTLRFQIGYLSYSPEEGMNSPYSEPTIMAVSVIVVVIFIIFVGFLFAYRRKSTESNRVLKNMQEQMDILELRVAAECKEAFAELQTEITDLTSDLVSGGIPFLEYRQYAIKILFPNVEDHIVLKWERPELLCKDKGLRLFGQLVMNKTFILLFIRTLESNRYFSMRDRVNVASLIMVTLQCKMVYCTDILKTLLAELIEKCMEGKSHPKLLLRRTESVAEKMLSVWFTFLLYKFLRECAGEPLFMLFRAVKQQIDRGPVDVITSEARYSLSEEKLIRKSIDFKPMTIYVSLRPHEIFVNMSEHLSENIPVRVLDCDTISQVKEKSLDTIYRTTPYSKRPPKDQLDLEWRTGTSGRLFLYDEDSTTKIEGSWKRCNTLQHYNVPDGACLNLVYKQSSIYNLSIFGAESINEKSSHKYETLNLGRFNSTSPTLSRATSPLSHDHGRGLKAWHLIKHHDNDYQKEGECGNKMVSEIYLTRLLATKGTLQKFVDDLFETIFSAAHRGSALPMAIKYMFDFLDDQALQHGISDPEVLHTWKSNSLPLRFWVNLIKNPNFVFDIHKSNIVDSCLSVVAQTFMDSCSTSDHRLGKDSPSSKLLYAKDIPSYKDLVERYYSDIKMMAPISDQDMNSMLADESQAHLTEFNTNCALHELYSYALKYNESLTLTLEEDEFSQKQRLARKLEQVHAIIADEKQP